MSSNVNFNLSLCGLGKNKNFIGSKCPNSEYLSINGFYIPSGLGLKNYEIKYIIDCVNKTIN